MLYVDFDKLEKAKEEIIKAEKKTAMACEKLNRLKEKITQIEEMEAKEEKRRKRGNV